MKLKKTAVWICVFALLLSCFGAAAGAAASVSLELQGPDTLPEVGESFEVLLLINENPGICSAQVVLSYNQAAIKCVGIDKGKPLTQMLSATNAKAQKGAIIAAATTDKVTQTGVLASFWFEVIGSGNPDFSVSECEFTDGSVSYPVDITVTVLGSEPDPEQKEETPASTETDVQQEAPAATETDTETGTQTSEPEEKQEESGSAGSGSGKEQTAAEEPAEEGGAVLHVSFSDVGESHWAAKNIERAAAMGLVQGRDDGSFDPSGKMTRAELVTVLWRLAGKPAAETEQEFTDVKSSDWYAPQVYWAASTGIVKGNDDGSFDPNGKVTREQIVTMLYRMNGGVSGMELLVGSTYDTFYTDSGEISIWAKSAMYWAVFNEIVKGVTENTLSPRSNATRAEVVTLVLRFADMIK